MYSTHALAHEALDGSHSFGEVPQIDRRKPSFNITARPDKGVRKAEERVVVLEGCFLLEDMVDQPMLHHRRA